MNRVVFAVWSGDIRQPLCCETRPLESMCHDKVIEEWSVLLPNFILLIYDPFLHCLVVCCGVCMCVCVVISNTRNSAHTNCTISLFPYKSRRHDTFTTERIKTKKEATHEGSLMTAHHPVLRLLQVLVLSLTFWVDVKVVIHKLVSAVE